MPNPNLFGRLPPNFLNMLHQQQAQAHLSPDVLQQKLLNANAGFLNPMAASQLFMPSPNAPNSPPTSANNGMFAPDAILNFQTLAQQANPLFFLQELQKVINLTNGVNIKKN